MNSNPSSPRIMGADNPAFAYPTDAPPLGDTKETVVSFVIKDAEKRGGGGTSAHGHDDDGQWTVMLSALYGVILILTGAAFPLYEALQHKWLNSHGIGIYLAYLFLGSTVFLIYLQLVISTEAKREAKAKLAHASHSSSRTPSVEENRTKEDTVTDDSAERPIPKEMVRMRKFSPSPGTCSCPGSRTASPMASPAVVWKNGLRAPFPVGINVVGVDYRNKRGCLRLDLSSTAGSPPSSKPTSEPSSPDRCPNLPISGAGKDDGSESYDEDEDLVYEQVELREQTATLTHEGASFYLRLGCLLFGIANFVFVSVEIHAYMMSSPLCVYETLIYPYICQLIFLLVQTFFVFKHTRVHVRRSKGLIRFGLQHVLATNLCIWLRVLTKEVMEAFEKQHPVVQYMDPGNNDNTTSTSISSTFENISTNCNQEFVHQLSPYLFPFVLEYSLIVVAVMASIFHGLNLRVNTDMFASLQRYIHSHPGKVEESLESGHHFFSKAHRGLYLGVILMSATVVSIILFFYSLGTSGNSTEAVMIYYCTDNVISVLLIIALVIGFQQLRALEITYNRDNTIDNILLMVSMSGLFLLQIVILIASLSAVTGQQARDYNPTTAGLQISACIINILHGLMQTAFVMAGLQLCAPTKEHRDQKPGRGVVTFLVIANLALWIYKTFQVKELSMTNLEDVYGPIAWPLILNVSLPLLLFYHFHSSVCLADIWYSAYEMEMGPKYRSL